MMSKLTRLIQGGEALPVRAIPFVSSWGRFSPVPLVRYLAQNPVGFTEWDKPLTAYTLRDGKAVAVPVSDWEAFEAQAEAGGVGGLGKLPAGVFVWLDEFTQIMSGRAHTVPDGFETKWQETFGESYSDKYEKPWEDDPQYAGQDWPRPTPHDDDTLVLDPLLMDDETRAMVLEGFDVRVSKQLPTAPAKIGKGDNKTEKTLILDAKVLELMDKFWNERTPGTRPVKSALCRMVYTEMLRGPVRGERGDLTEGMVRDAAKPWRHPLILPAFVPDSKFNEKTHPFKR